MNSLTLHAFLLLPPSAVEALFSLKEDVKEASRLELCEAVGDEGITGSSVGKTAGEHLHVHNNKQHAWLFGAYHCCGFVNVIFYIFYHK
jgi:hypothetical protein